LKGLGSGLYGLGTYRRARPGPLQSLSVSHLVLVERRPHIFPQLSGVYRAKGLTSSTGIGLGFRPKQPKVRGKGGHGGF